MGAQEQIKSRTIERLLEEGSKKDLLKKPARNWKGPQQYVHTPGSASTYSVWEQGQIGNIPIKNESLSRTF